MKLTVVIPSYNEGNDIKFAYEKLVDVLKRCSIKQIYDYEIIFIDDGSNDNTLSVIKQFQVFDKNVKYISFTRNFGKEAGILAGLTYSSGDAVILMDADLQHPPQLIPKMVDYYLRGYDQVIAKRNRIGDSKSKTFLSKLYYKIVNHFIDVKLEDGIGDFRLLSQRSVKALLSMGEYNRFSKGMFCWIGFNQKVIKYENQRRVGGTSKWNFRKLVQYGIDGILSFNNKPLRSTIYIGFLMMILGIIYLIYSLTRILIIGIDVPGYFTIISAILIMAGVQILAIGIIGEYIGRIYYEVKMRPHFLIQESNIEKVREEYFMEDKYGKQDNAIF
ncbi:glycosyltransferase family 2 protein [Clostridium sp. P21]|uniref:Glycosyltransferase family 2 protein n=1 Tax=Clostridium muellerianum TaxID=2716538 RepID=A0A7Y0EG46_9CLOT|nr:glycosyltransferase family 2 protein [Clostridium muellerianum]NMM62783.1 glycosyltransferase family 2 protein [Clostridium muellerianum]